MCTRHNKKRYICLDAVKFTFITMKTDLEFYISNTVTSRHRSRDGSQANPSVLIAGVILSIAWTHCERNSRWSGRQGESRLRGWRQGPFLDPATFAGPHSTSRGLPVLHWQCRKWSARQGFLGWQAGAALSLQKEGALLKGTLDQHQEPIRRWSIADSRQRWQEVRQPSPGLLKRRWGIVRVTGFPGGQDISQRRCKFP